MASLTRSTTLLLICLAAITATAQHSCSERSRAEKTKDGLFLLKETVTNTRDESLAIMPTAKAFIRATIHPDINVNNEILREMEKNSSLTFNDARAVVIEHLQSESARNVTLRRELFDKLFGLAMQRQKLEAMERTDAIIAITRLMDAIINDSCVYMRKELKLPNLNCSSVEEMKSLQSQLEMITKVFELHNKMNDTVLSLNSADELAKPCKCNIWENVVSSPCDNDGTVGDRLYKERKLFALQCCA